MFKVQGGAELEGEITIGGSKNAVLPVIAACLLIEGKTTLTNVPEIGDVYTFLSILSDIGVESHFENHTLVIDASKLSNSGFDLQKIKKIRVSILLLAPLLKRLGSIAIPSPGGCKIGNRPIDSHLIGLEAVGYSYKYEGEEIELSGKTTNGDLEVSAGFGVTSTENILVASILRSGKTEIHNAAIEPHVMNLVDFLRQAGANISLRYDHTIIVEGVANLKTDTSFAIVSDYIQSGSYMIMGALSAKESITIHNARIGDLYTYIEKLREIGVRIENLGNDSVKVYKAQNLKACSIQTNIFPGFPTDLQSPFSILMTRAQGESKIHEVLFEGRLNWLVELDKMGGDTSILNPHEASIRPKGLIGADVTSWDLRAGCAMVIAAMIAEGETRITNIEYIKRGYENFVENLQNLGVDIVEEIN